jgi:hypothetical protein
MLLRGAALGILLGLALLTGCAHDAKPAAASPPPGPAACLTDDDCRVESDYCGGCACRALTKGETVPACTGTTVQCLVDPCRAKRAACLVGTCTTAAAAQP